MLERGGDGGYHWGRAPIQQAVFDRLHGDVDPPDYWDWDSDESEPTRVTRSISRSSNSE